MTLYPAFRALTKACDNIFNVFLSAARLLRLISVNLTWPCQSQMWQRCSLLVSLCVCVLLAAQSWAEMFKKKNGRKKISGCRKLNSFLKRNVRLQQQSSIVLQTEGRKAKRREKRKNRGDISLRCHGDRPSPKCFQYHKGAASSTIQYWINNANYLPPHQLHFDTIRWLLMSSIYV